MQKNMKMKKISSKLIKPHTPTPLNLNKYKISFLDKCLAAMNTGVVLFYESNPEDRRQQLQLDLEESLAKVLVDFYPLAGRYMKNDFVVHCNDEGAEFVEAEAVGVELVDVAGKTETVQLLFPDHYFKSDEAADNPLLSIQITRFSCGGAAVAISVSHRIFDGSSLETFIAAWANASICNNNNKMAMVGGLISPTFDIPSLLPSMDELGSGLFDFEDRVIVLKRLLFDKVALAGLKSGIRPRISVDGNGKTSSSHVSGVRVVSAVIAKALIRLDGAKHGRIRDFVITQNVNLRGRTLSLPQPRHSCGNFAIPMMTRRVAASEAESIGTQEIVHLLGDALRKTISDHAEILSPGRDGRTIILNALENAMTELIKPEANIIPFNDWSKFEFYEADFGWGAPFLTSIGPQRSNCVMFMSNKEGDGIEAWVYLEEDDMPYFEKDPQIKQYFTT